MLKAQMGGTFTTTSSISTTCTISYAGLGQYVVPVKSMALGNDTIISVFYDNTAKVSYIQRTIDGTTITRVVSISNVIIEDFDIDYSTYDLYICGQKLSANHGFFAVKNVNTLFTSASTFTTEEDTSATTIKRIDVYRDVLKNIHVSMITSNNEYINYSKKKKGSQYINDTWVFVPSGDYKLLDVEHTKSYAVILGSKNLGKEFVLFKHPRFLISEISDILSGLKIPVTPEIVICNYSVTPSMPFYGYEHNCKIVALDSDSTNNIFVGMGLVGYPSYATFGVINLSDLSITNQQELILSNSARPDIYDLEYNPYNGKVLCLMYTIDYAGETVFEINPTASSSYVTNLVYPTQIGLAANVKNLLKDITIYDSKYYLLFGRTNEAKITFVDKKYGYYGGNCHDRYQHTVTPSTRITKGDAIRDTLQKRKLIDYSINNMSLMTKTKSKICQ